MFKYLLSLLVVILVSYKVFANMETDHPCLKDGVFKEGDIKLTCRHPEHLK